MNHDHGVDVARRNTLERGLAALAGVTIVWVARGSAIAAPAKLSKAAVQYVNAGKDEGKDCDDCSQFVPSKTATDLGTCKIVEGAINPHGHCIAFTPKPKT
jgi:uncharacterized Fe-S center protein